MHARASSTGSNAMLRLAVGSNTIGKKGGTTANLSFGLLVRFVLSILGAAVLGTLGHLLGWFVWPQSGSLTGLVVTAVSATGLLAGIGALAGWYDLDGDKGKNLGVLGIGILGGMGGAWSGHFVGRVLSDGGTYGDASRIASVFGAMVGANLLSPTMHLCWDRVIRHK